MAQSVVDAHREGAEITVGDAACRESSLAMLREFGMPDGLLPVEDIEEFGHHRESGFVWVRQRRSRNHTFRQIGRLVSYAGEVSGFIEKGRIRRLTGVTTKEFLFWLTICDIVVDPADPAKITFKTPAGFSRSFPSTAFLLEKPPRKAK